MKVSADYRMLALDALRGKWKTAVLTGIVLSDRMRILQIISLR